MFTRLLALLIAWVIAFPAYGMDVNGELKKALLEKQASDPTGYEARVYYNTTSKKPLVYNGVIWSELGGSSGGSGEKNYIAANPSGATDTAGWTCVGDLDIARTTTLGDLPREITTASGLKITADANVQSVADYCYFDFTLDDIDVSKKLNIKWSQKQTGTYVASDLAVVVTTQADRTTALHTPQVTNIAAADYDFNAYGFDTSTTLTLSLVIRATADMATNGGIVISDVVVGPGKIITGAAGQYLGSLSGFTVGNNGSKGFTATNRCWRKGNLLTCKFTLDGDATASGSAATTALSFVLPAGYTIDDTALPHSSLADDRNNLGYYTEFGIATAGTYSNQQQILALTSTSFRFIKGATNTVVRTTDLNVARDMNLQGEFSVPIAEWAGSGTVNLAQNDVEYASSTAGGSEATWDAASVAGDTIYGPRGSLMGVELTAARNKTVRFLTPIQATDDLELQIDNGGLGFWVPFESKLPGHKVPNWDFGSVVTPLNETDVQVRFNRFLIAGTTYNSSSGAAGYLGSVTAGSRWRLKKSKAGSAVGFGLATATESGLLQPPTSIEDVKATQMGLKAYSHGTTYSGGIAPTVTLTGGGGTLSSVDVSKFIPYQTQGGVWRMKFNLTVTLSSTARTAITLAINGFTFAAVGLQSISAGSSTTTAYVSRATAQTSSNELLVSHASATTTVYHLSGDVELTSKPTWAY